MVFTGLSSHASKEFNIITKAPLNPNMMTITQSSFTSLLLVVEMCPRPWMVEDSRNVLTSSMAGAQLLSVNSCMGVSRILGLVQALYKIEQ